MKRLTAICLILALLLCACGTQSDVPTKATAPETQAADTPTETQVSAGFGVSYLPEYGLNPYTCTSTVNRAIFSLLYESLFVVSSRFRAEPVLCESFTASEDGRTYRYTLVQGVKFSDGTPLTAQDVAASLEAARSSALYSGRLSHVTSITADSDTALTIVLDTAYENFSLMLDVPVVSAATTAAQTPLGTGPYAVQGETLRRNGYWWQTQAPAVSQEVISLYAAQTPNDIRDAFEFGGTDLVYCDPNSSAAVGYRCDYEAWEAPTTVLHYLGFNLYSGIFTNTTLRTAVTYAIDREELTNTIYGGFAQGTVLPCAPGSDLYDSQLAEDYAYQPDAFRAAVYQSGVSTSKSSPGVLLVCADDPVRVDAAQSIADFMETCGLYLQVKALDQADYLAALSAGNFDAYLGETRLTANFDLSEFFSTGGSLSYGAISDATLASLCTASLENSGSYAELCSTLLKTAPICPLVFKSYEICVTRGAIQSIAPALDCVFHNAATARSLADADRSYEAAQPTVATGEDTEPVETTEASSPEEAAAP